MKLKSTLILFFTLAFLNACTEPAQIEIPPEPVTFESGNQYLGIFFELINRGEYERIHDQMLSPAYADSVSADSLKAYFTPLIEKYGEPAGETFGITSARFIQRKGDDDRIVQLIRNLNMHVRFGDKVIYGEINLAGPSEPKLQVDDIWLTEF